MDSHSDPLRKIPTKHAPEAKADIGTSLKAARTKKGASLDAVAQHTRIPKKFLDALENNRFEEFPALAYLRGFLKSYCDYLELDFDPIWKLVVPEPAAPAPAPAPAPKPAAKTPTPAPRKETPKAPTPAPAAHAPAPAPAHAPAHAAKHEEDEHPHAASSSATAAVGLVIAGAAVLLIGLVMMKKPAAPTKATPPVESQPPAALEPVKPPTEAALEIVFRRDMWVSITVDGVEKFQGRVPQGSKQSWKPKKAVVLKASDPQALKLTLNGSAFTLPAPDAEGAFKIEAP